MIQNFVFIILLFFEGLLFVEYNLSIINLIFFILTCLFALIVARKKIIFSFASWWLLIYLFCSFLVVSLFKFAPKHFSLSSSDINDFDFVILAKFTIYTFFTYFVSLFFINNNIKSVHNNWNTEISVPSINWKALFILGFFLSAISRTLGIGDMSEGPSVVLPYHIGGIIQFARKDVLPILALLSYVDLRSRSKSVTVFFVIFLIWCLFESWVRLSKSVIIFSFLPIIIFDFLTFGRKSYDKLIRRFFPFFLIALLIYPLVENMRSNDRDISLEVNEDNLGTYLAPNSTNYLVRPFTRTFHSGYLFLVDNSYVDNNKIFDFSKASVILSMGGSARFQTFVIDGYPEGVRHSSGSTPFIDSFLVGGYGLFFLILILFVFFASYIDYIIFSTHSYIIPSILCFMYYRVFDMLSASFFIDPMCIRYLIVYGGIVIYLKIWNSRKGRIIK